MENYITITKPQEEFMKRYLPNEEVSTRLAEYFAVFSDMTRVRILSALAISGMCVGDLSNLLRINQTTLSHQLKLLRDAKIVGYRREGKLVIYSIINPFVEDIMIIGVDNLEKQERKYKIAE